LPQRFIESHLLRDRSLTPPGIITQGPGGALWFSQSMSDSNGNHVAAIGRITMEGDITLFPMAEAHSAPCGITTGPDGNLWFTDTGRNEIGRISPDGSVARCAIPTPNSAPNRIALGADGKLWFTERSGNKIGRITP
jgi:virginiamycin B lyase